MLNILFIDRDKRWEGFRFGPHVCLSPYEQITEYDPENPRQDNLLANAIRTSEQTWEGRYEKYLLEVDNCQLVILHTSNRWAEEFFKNRCKNKATVLFSAGGVISDNFDKDHKATVQLKNAGTSCCFINYGMLVSNLTEFLNEFDKLQGSGTPPFDVLKHGAMGARVTMAHRLRKNILTPFIALHLALQAHQENRAGGIWQMEEFGRLNEYREEYASGSEQKDLLRFVSLLNADDCMDNKGEGQFLLDKYFKPFFTSPPVKAICSKLAEKSQAFTRPEIEGCLKYIEVLAHNMEQVVSCIEFNERPELQGFLLT